MLIQTDDETRRDYLLRVLTEFMHNTPAGAETVEYDGTTCDGMCLLEDFLAEDNSS